MRKKEISARDVMAAHLARIEQVNARVNAVVTLVADRAMADAARADEAMARRGSRRRRGSRPSMSWLSFSRSSTLARAWRSISSRESFSVGTTTTPLRRPCSDRSVKLKRPERLRRTT